MGSTTTSHQTEQHTNTRHRSSGRRRWLVAGVATTLALTACGGDDDDAGFSVEDTAESSTEMIMVEGGDDAGFIATADSADASAESTSQRAPSALDLGTIGRDVIVEMRVVLASDDIERTVASVMASASTLGGGVASSDVNYGADDANDGFAVLVVKVPPDAVDRLLSGLESTATVQSINQSAQDVTEQLVNLDVRIRNAQQSVDNVRGFMEATENLDELVRLEAELTRRLTELEQLEAQQRNLSDRVALSTVTIEVVPTPTVIAPEEPEATTIGGALESGWSAFVGVAFALMIVLASSLPFLVAIAALGGAAWLVNRFRRPDQSSETAGRIDHERIDPEPSEAAEANASVGADD